MSTLYHISLTTYHDDGSAIRGQHPNADILIDHLMGTSTNMEPITNLRSSAGGNKVFCQDVFLAVVNYLDVVALISVFRSIEWEHPESAILQIKCDGSNDFLHVYPIEANSKKNDLKLFMVTNPSPIAGSISAMLVAHETADGARMFHPNQISNEKKDYNPLSEEDWNKLDAAEEDAWDDDGNLKPCIWPPHWHQVNVEEATNDDFVTLTPGIAIVFEYQPQK